MHAVYDDFVKFLTDGCLSLLSPGQQVNQASSLVLLRGSVQTKPLINSSKANPFGKDYNPKEMPFEILAPSALPFLVAMDAMDAMDIEVRTFWAGPEGAIVLSCPGIKGVQQQIITQDGEISVAQCADLSLLLCSPTFIFWLSTRS